MEAVSKFEYVLTERTTQKSKHNKFNGFIKVNLRLGHHSTLGAIDYYILQGVGHSGKLMSFAKLFALAEKAENKKAQHEVTRENKRKMQNQCE